MNLEGAQEVFRVRLWIFHFEFMSNPELIKNFWHTFAGRKRFSLCREPASLSMEFGRIRKNRRESEKHCQESTPD
jgi:hypothetical protein